MMQFVAFMQGKKTYAAALAGVATILAHAAGVIDRGTTDAVLYACGFGGLAALRAGVPSGDSGTPSP